VLVRIIGGFLKGGVVNFPLRFLGFSVAAFPICGFWAVLAFAHRAVLACGNPHLWVLGVF